MMLKELEDSFIERSRRDFGGLTPESEMLLRYAYATGAQELGLIAHRQGVNAQRERVLEALGASPRETRPLP